jgi:hypothetical protein
MTYLNSNYLNIFEMISDRQKKIPEIKPLPTVPFPPKKKPGIKPLPQKPPEPIKPEHAPHKEPITEPGKKKK